MTASPLQTRYDPWQDLAANWPEVEVVIEPMSGRLLGVLRYPVIALRAGTSSAQRRCTLAHEIVHLERGVADCGPWAGREELLVHREVARRLVPLPLLSAAVRDLGGQAEVNELALALDVDLDTARCRLGMLSEEERATIASAAPNGADPDAAAGA
jgi:hypothetical protein